MKLRNHPLLNSLWPPVWTEKYAARKLTGEIGTLAHVGDNSRLSMLYLHITHEGLPYWGALRIKDSASRSAIYALLQEQKGQTIREIRDLDISQAL